MSETKRGKKRMNEEGNSTKDNQRARHWASQVFRYHAVRSHFFELDDDMTLFMFLKAHSGCPVVSRLQNQQHQNQSNEDGGFEIGCFALDGKVCLDSGDEETYKYILLPGSPVANIKLACFIPFFLSLSQALLPSL